MSTLTKVLIVLQVVFSILLCGVVVSYVATADNYREQYDTQRNAAQQAISQKNKYQKEWEDFKDTTVKDLEAAQAQVTSLKAQITELNSQKAALELEKAGLVQDVDKFASSSKANANSADKQRELFEQTNAQLNQLKADQAKLDRQLKETNDTLIEKLAIISQQNEQIRTLTEEKADLRGQLEQQYRLAGRQVPTPQPITLPSGAAQKAMQTAPPLDLKGQITGVDLKEQLAQISIGANQGVREKMTFHVTRGSQYVCDIHVIAVDSDRAVGTIEMSQANPKNGDMVATNL